MFCLIRGPIHQRHFKTAEQTASAQKCDKPEAQRQHADGGLEQDKQELGPDAQLWVRSLLQTLEIINTPTGFRSNI